MERIKKSIVYHMDVLIDIEKRKNGHTYKLITYNGDTYDTLHTWDIKKEKFKVIPVRIREKFGDISLFGNDDFRFGRRESMRYINKERKHEFVVTRNYVFEYEFDTKDNADIFIENQINIAIKEIEMGIEKEPIFCPFCENETRTEYNKWKYTIFCDDCKWSWGPIYYKNDTEKCLYPDTIVCAKCGGRCCKAYAGFIIPDDIDDDMEMLNEIISNGNYVICIFPGDVPMYAIRPAHVSEESSFIKIEKINYGRYTHHDDPCIFYSEAGCTLSSDERPYQCRMYVPDPDNIGNCKQMGHSSEKIIKIWSEQYRNIIESILHKIKYST